MIFPELLTLVFVVLKLCGVLAWSWFFVLLPMIIEGAACLVIFIVILIIYLVASPAPAKFRAF